MPENNAIRHSPFAYWRCQSGVTPRHIGVTDKARFPHPAGNKAQSAVDFVGVLLNNDSDREYPCDGRLFPPPVLNADSYTNVAHGTTLIVS